MFETDRSASRGEMAARELLIFKHESKLGNASAHRLFDRLKIAQIDDNKPPRSVSDYRITFDGTPINDFIAPPNGRPTEKDLGNGITLIRHI
jgi:CRISPR-associated protein Csd2